LPYLYSAPGGRPAVVAEILFQPQPQLDWAIIGRLVLELSKATRLRGVAVSDYKIFLTFQIVHVSRRRCEKTETPSLLILEHHDRFTAMAELSPLPNSAVLRRARRSQPDELVETDLDLYPANVPSLVGSLHNTGYYQSMMSNTNNYAGTSRLDVTEVVDGKTIERKLADEVQCQAYLDVSYRNWRL
jgi:hypothetical protein